MNDPLHLICSFPNDVVAFRVRTLFKDINYLLQVSMQDGNPSTIKKFEAPRGEALNIVSFEFRGFNILFFDSENDEYVDEVKIDRAVFLNGCEPIQIKIQSVNAGAAGVRVSLYVLNALVIRQELSFSVVDVDKELKKQGGV